MLILSTIFGNVNSVLALASLLSVQNPLTQNAYRNSEAQHLRKPLESSHGDPLTLLNFYREWLYIKQSSTVKSRLEKGENSKIWTRKRCLEEQRFVILSFAMLVINDWFVCRFYEVTKLLEQFRDILHEANLLSKMTEGELSSSERAIRHGELKQLKFLRYQLKTESKSRNRKQLKYEMYNFGDNDKSQDKEEADIRDVEFRIVNDFKRYLW